MPEFRVNKPIATTSPTIEVTGTLPVGTYRFRLVVEDQAGNRSDPDEVTVKVVDQRVREPIDVFQPTIPIGRVTPVTPIVTSGSGLIRIP